MQRPFTLGRHLLKLLLLFPEHVLLPDIGHDERTHSSRRAVDQNLLSRLNVSIITKTLQGSERCHRYRSCLLEGHVVRLDDQYGFRNTSAYSASAPWLIQTLKPEARGSRRHAPNTLSPGLNCVTLLPTASTRPATSTPSRVNFGSRSPITMRPAPFTIPPSSGLRPAARTLINTSSSLGNRLFDVLDLDNVRRSVSGIDGGFHWRSRCRVCAVTLYNSESAVRGRNSLSPDPGSEGTCRLRCNPAA